MSIVAVQPSFDTRLWAASCSSILPESVKYSRPEQVNSLPTPPGYKVTAVLEATAASSAARHRGARVQHGGCPSAQAASARREPCRRRCRGELLLRFNRSLTSAAGSAMGMLFEPMKLIALRFLAPNTAPKPLSVRHVAGIVHDATRAPGCSRRQVDADDGRSLRGAASVAPSSAHYHRRGRCRTSPRPRSSGTQRYQSPQRSVASLNVAVVHHADPHRRFRFPRHAGVASPFLHHAGQTAAAMLEQVVPFGRGRLMPVNSLARRAAGTTAPGAT